MNFNSIDFIIFYPIVVLLNFIVPLKYRLYPLLAASLFFYARQSGELVFLIITTTVISYVSGLLIEKYPVKKKLWMIISVVASLAVLFFFKYYNFLAGSIGSIAGFDATLDLILPVGISFYTFQTLSYSIDVYRGNIPAEHNFFYYALFVTFFPQLVAGPIERPENLLPQLKVEHKFNSIDLIAGSKRMLAGYFKKVVVADMSAAYVDRIFNSPEGQSGASVLIASVFFAVQIYCDFSGYTDIAIGCARVMGYRLMQNFDRPYSAENIKDFWARWHISLTSWFKDYLYIPLGGNRKGKPRMILNLFIVFLVSGLWHGAEWTFVIWGALHGIYRVVGYVTLKPRENLYAKLKIDTKHPIVRFWRRFITFALVCFAWIFFRANNTPELIVLLKNVGAGLGGLSFISEMEMTVAGIVALLLSYVVMIMIDRRYTLPESDTPIGGGLMKSGVSVYLLWALMFAWLILKATGGSGAFIYFQF